MNSVDLKESFSLEAFKSLIQDIGVQFSFNINSNFEINAISDGRHAVEKSFCFLVNIEGIEPLSDVLYIVPQVIPNASCMLVDDPRYVFIKILEVLEKKNITYSLLPENRDKGIHESAEIDSKVVLEDEVVIGKNTVISAGCVIKSGTVIGKNSIIRENTVIGCNGIALYKAKNGDVLRFPHLSGVEIGDNVEIGANSVIVRGTLKPTVIENDVVIGNLCNIGQGAVIEGNVWMSVGTLIGGNCLVENNSTLGLGVSVKDNLRIEEKTTIGMGAVVTKNTKMGCSYFGNPAKPLRNLKAGPSR